jgi:ferrochelatase
VTALGGSRIGVLIVNLGTPDAPTPKALRRYLAEFLWDPRVVEIPRPLWWLILHGVVLRLRPRKSAEAYQRIWTDKGSPLLMGSISITDKIKSLLAKKKIITAVELGMRYGNPSLESALGRLRSANLDRIIVLPLYPQHAAASTGTVFDEIGRIFKGWRYIPEISFISDYHLNVDYLDALSHQVKSFREKNGSSEVLLFSYHGLPDRSRRLGDHYYNQCVATTEQLVKRLKIKKPEWKIVFQSRFGKEEWLRPYCSDVLKELASEGTESVDIICPGFPVDCLETLDEIAAEYKALFLEAGGKQFNYIPALNDSELHIEALTAVICQRI